MDRTIWVGWDPRETDAFAVAAASIARHLSDPAIRVGEVRLSALQAADLYQRPISWRPGPSGRPVMWDTISDAPMSTEHACARFLVPHLARRSGQAHGWALFMDGDMLVRADLAEVFAGLDPAKALYCVQHAQSPATTRKMDGQMQTAYARKNWSSFMLFNLDHPSNDALSVGLINALPGRDLHRFCWLADHEIGALDPSWNVLVGQGEPRVAHFTHGLPDMEGYEAVPFADEWRSVLADVRGERAA